MNIRNSLVIASATTGICISVGSLAAFGFSQYRFPLHNFLLALIIAVRIIPPVALLIPFYIQAQTFSLFDTWYILIITNTFMNLPFVVWMLEKFFDEIPKPILEAARIDGCSKLGTLQKIVLPLSGPSIGAAMIICFLWSWNEFMFALTLTQSIASKPVSVAINDFVKDVGVAWVDMAAGGVIVCLPAILFCIFFQKWIIKGMTAGGVKF